MSFRDTQNPGIGGLDELTLSEETAVQTMASLGTALQVLRTNAGENGVEWATVSGTGDVVKVGTPANNQVGVWTGDGSIEGDAALTFDTATNLLTTGILNLTSLTASEIVITDGSKNLVSAAVATYPSLTELSYVKGVTSAIQTQINAISGGGLVWNEVVGTSQSGAVNNGYILNNAGLVTLTIPTTAAVGDIVRVVGKGAGGWLIAQNASENINIGNATTTTGVGGSLASTNRYDAVEMVCTVANTTWTVISSVGNITYV